MIQLRPTRRRPMSRKESMCYCSFCSGPRSLTFHPISPPRIGNGSAEKGPGSSNDRLTYGTLKKFLLCYSVQEHGGLFIYLPSWEDLKDQNARDWISILRSRDALMAGPWVVRAKYIHDRLEGRHGHLLSSDTENFTIYRAEKSLLTVI